MSLLFGNLTQDFVSFSLAENSVTQALQSGDPTAIAQAQQILDTTAVGFRHSAALDASYLTYIGERLVSSLTSHINYVQRCRHVRVHLCVYVYLGLHRRG
jgi:ATP-binding cassette subfamily B (MDR/TAP) protein 1